VVIGMAKTDIQKQYDKVKAAKTAQLKRELAAQRAEMRMRATVSHFFHHPLARAIQSQRVK